MRSSLRRAFAFAACTVVLVPATSLAVSTDATEFLVNQTTASEQAIPRVASNVHGQFVIVWRTQLEVGYGMRGRVYRADGTPDSGELELTSGTSLGNPSVAIAENGDFAAAWVNTGSAESTAPGDLSVRCFHANGLPKGPELRFASAPAIAFDEPAMAMSGSGAFVIAWDSDRGDGDVFAQRFDASCAKSGAEFRVNTTVDRYQGNPAIAMTPAGAFVVAWGGSGSGTQAGIFFQRFDAAGNRLGTQVAAIQSPTGRLSPTQFFPAIAIDAAGNFVVACESDVTNSAVFNVSARRFDWNGNPLDPVAFQVNQTTAIDFRPSVAMDADGDWSIAWISGVVPELNIMARRYGAASTSPPPARGPQFLANAFVPGIQSVPVIAGDGSGDFVIAWSGMGLSDIDGVYARRYVQEAQNLWLSHTSSPTRFDATPVAGGPAGTLSFETRFCNLSAQQLSGLVSRTAVLSGGNNLLSRSRDGISAAQPGGPGSEQDVARAGSYADGLVGVGECVTVPYVIGLASTAPFTFSVDVIGDPGNVPAPSAAPAPTPITLP